MKYALPKRKVLVFSQWSRKGYAIFASLGKIVKIARVAVDICNKALLKTSSLTGISTDVSCLKKNFTGLLEELRQVEGVPEALITQLVLFTKNIVLTTSAQKEGGLGCSTQFNGLNPCFINNKTWVFFIDTI